MEFCKLGLALVAAMVLSTAVELQPAQAGSVAVGAAIRSGLPAAGAFDARHAIVHFHRTIEEYCYPRDYWWFYRPYTTALEGYQRCMPYFRYLDPTPAARRGTRSDGSVR
jgi:hypothetical protein